MDTEDIKQTPPGGDPSGAQENGSLGETGSEAENKPNSGDSQAFDAPAVEITVFAKSGGDLTKKVHWNADHTGIVSDSRDCKMSTGFMARGVLVPWYQLADGLPQFAGDRAIAIGRMKPELPNTLNIVKKDNPLCGLPGYASRTAGNIIFAKGQPALILLDYDTKGMTPENKARLDELGGFFGALKLLWPGFDRIGYITRRSTSAAIYNVETGQRFGEGGWHCFALISDGSKVQAFLDALHQRAWLNGLGWVRIGEAGQFLERSIIDVSVGGAERLIFEANPVLDVGLAQDFRPAEVHHGESGKLTFAPRATELAAFKRAVSTAKAALEDEATPKRKAFRARKKDEAILTGMDPDRAEAMANRWTENILRSGVPIIFENPEIGVKYVWEILGDPERYDGESCFDPIEGEAYGRANARFFANQLCINCFAHGGGVFFLRHDAASVKELIERGDPGKAVEILCTLASIMDVTPVEQKILVKLAGERNACGEKVASAALKEALGAERARRAEAERERLDRESTTIRLPAEFPDCKINPVMAVWDDILAHAEAFDDDTEPFSEPPMRDVEGWPVKIRWRDSVGLHALTSAGANAEGEDEKSILPAPDQYLLSKHDKFSLEREVGNYITFFERTGGGARDVAPPEKHVLHYLGFNDSKAPRVHAVLTLPIVTTDGTVVAENGLNRELKSVLRIDRTLLRWIPKKEDCTPEAVRAAYKFLTEEWFVDVLTDRRGKAILVAFALSIIERCLISNRPIFTVTAGQRGGGKTTILMMIILAVLGVMPSAAAWAMDPNERKKALFAYLLEGLPALVWDNIPRGSVISCPSIERSCTAKGYSDRILGETGIGQADAYTIQTLTGNCIRCKGDLASRNLTVLITTERPDPENREFKHLDPMSWTNDHRGKILHALYTILLAKNDEQTTEGTRFKEWQWLVGSQVEFAANAPDVPAEQRISFKEIFLEGERESDDDAMDYADVLGVLFNMFPPSDATPRDPNATLIRGIDFDVMSVLKRVGGSDNRMLQDEDGRQLQEEILNLRLWLTYPGANGPTIRSIPKLLKSIDGTPVMVGGGIMSLHWQQDTHKKKPIFWIEFRPDLNPDGSKTNQAERVELGIAGLEPEQHDAHVKENERMKNPPSSRAGPCQGRGATPDYLAHAPISGNPFQVLEELAAHQSGEVKMSSFDDLIAKDKGEQP